MDRKYLQDYSMMNNYLMNGGVSPYGSPYLAHYGVPGMKWGQHLFAKLLGKKQDKSVTDTATVKRIKGRSSRFVSRVKRRMQINDAKKIKAAQKTLGIRDDNGQTESKANRKKRVLKSRSARELYKNADLFTDEELRAAYSRLALEKQIRDLDPEPAKMSTVDKWIDRTQKAQKLASNASNIANSGIKTYNTMADIYNAFSGSSKPLKKIGKEDNKKDNKKNNDDDDD